MTANQTYINYGRYYSTPTPTQMMRQSEMNNVENDKKW